MIVTVTLNAALDRTLTVPNFQRGQRHRASGGLTIAGGKGINIARALKPGGTFLMQDIKASSHVHGNLAHPLGTFLYAVSAMHCMTVSLAQGGEGLGAMWGEEKTREYLTRAGFTSVETHQLAHDLMNNLYVARK